MTLDEVTRVVLAERGGETGSWRWTLGFVERADRQFAGRWRMAALSGPEALAVRLPPHAGEPCHGDRRLLVPAGGATVADAAAALSGMRASYERFNQECWRRIAEAADAPFSTVVLTAAPLETDVHAGLRHAPGELIHLDGFHRLVGWAWAGRLDRTAAIQAIVAG